MRLLVLRLGLILVSLVAPLRSAAADAPPSRITARELEQGFSDTRVLVVPKGRTETAEARDDRIDRVEQRLGLRAERVYRHLRGIRAVRVPAGQSVAATIEQLRATGEFETVEPDRVVHAVAVPNDPAYTDGTLWGLHNTGQNSGVADADIDAPEGWNTRTDAASVVVAVVDSGGRTTHEDLAPNLWTNPSPGGAGFTNDIHGINAITDTGIGANDSTNDDDGHGTHVSGTIGGVGNNGKGVAGVAWKARIMVLKFLSADGNGLTSDVIQCLNYAVAQKNRGVPVRVINASYGSDSISQSELAAMRAVRDAGIIFVAAAGNDGRNLDTGRSYPASYQLDNIISVAASTRLDDLATFSNYGSGAVEIAAPGEAIYSTVNTADNAYASYNGTSMAAPHVSGVVALLAAQFPAETYRQLINRTLRGVDTKTQFAGKVATGGRLNLSRALTSTDNRPFNDHFAEAAAITGGTVQARSCNTGGSRETGEPNHAGKTGGASLWWNWTAPSTGTVNIDTVGSAFDTLLGVYTGASAGSLTTVASDDDGASGTASRVTFVASEGTTYRIAVDGKSGAAGLAILNVGLVPANDSFANAALATGPSWKVTAANAAATKEAGEPNHAGQPGGRSMWYRWTAPAARAYQVSVFSADVDPVVAVYTGASVGALTAVASNNDAVSGSGNALATFGATSGQTYFIAVDSVGTASGEFTLSLVDSDWQYATTDVVTSSPAVAADGTVYVGTFDQKLLALRPDGTLKWSFSTGRVDMASPAIAADGTVYVGDNNGKLFALSPSGTQLWTFSAGGPIPSSPAIAENGDLYFRSDDNALYALTRNGTEKWRFDTSGVSYSAPSLAPDGTVYVGSDSNYLLAVKPDGSRRWAVSTNGGVYTSPAVAGDGTVYAATLSGRLYAIRADGSTKWTYDAGGGISSSPVIGPDGTVYFGSYDKHLYAVRSDGMLRWKYATGDEIRASAPVVASDGNVYLGSYDGKLHAVRASDGTPVRTYSFGQRVRSSPVIANGRLYVGCNDYKLYALPLAATLANSDWPAFRHNPRHTGRAETITSDGVAPTLSTQPADATTTAGTTVIFTASATGDAPLAYQWYRDDTPIAGATNASYTVDNAQVADVGMYTVVVTNAAGSVTSAPAMLSLGRTAGGRILALATRGFVNAGEQMLIAGVVVNGAGPKRIILRGVGPNLFATGQFSQSEILADPRLQVFAGGTVIQSNDDWSNQADPTGLAAATSAVGLASLPANSRDASLLTPLAPGGYTVQISGAGTGSGVALVEAYDADPSDDSARLTAIATRGYVGTGSSIMIPGIALSGQRRLIIRGIGPGISGISQRLPDPLIRVMDINGTEIARNDNWGSAATKPGLTRSMQMVGLTPPADGSTDAALLITLPGGAYTVLVSDTGTGTGVALVEVYEAP